MRIVIIGGAGFVGLNLVNELSMLSCELLVVDSFECDTKSILLSLTSNFIELDLRTRGALDALLKEDDIVIHLAAKGNVVESVNDPRSNFESNVLLTFYVLESCAKAKVSKLVFSSTLGALFGRSEPPFAKSLAPSPISPYGASKLACEAYLSSFAQLNPAIQVSVLRFGNVAGKFCGHKRGVIQTFYAAFRDSLPITINDCYRDFVHVDDLTKVIINLIAASNRSSDINFQVYHLSVANCLHIREVAEIVAEEMQISSYRTVSTAPRLGEVSKVEGYDSSDLIHLTDGCPLAGSDAIRDAVRYLVTTQQ